MSGDTPSPTSTPQPDRRGIRVQVVRTSPSPASGKTVRARVVYAPSSSLTLRQALQRMAPPPPGRPVAIRPDDEEGSKVSAERTREKRLRRIAKRRGMRLEKSRRRDSCAIDYGWMVIDARTNAVLAAATDWGYGLDLDAVERFLNDGAMMT